MLITSSTLVCLALFYSCLSNNINYRSMFSYTICTFDFMSLSNYEFRTSGWIGLCLGPVLAYIGDWPGSGSDQPIGVYWSNASWAAQTMVLLFCLTMCLFNYVSVLHSWHNILFLCVFLFFPTLDQLTSYCFGVRDTCFFWIKLLQVLWFHFSW
jgi:hypothetical protein